MKKIFCLLALFMIFSSVALADIPPLPTPEPTPQTADAPVAESKCARAMAGGLFLSLAVIFVGIRLARSRKIEAKTAAAGGLYLLGDFASYGRCRHHPGGHRGACS